MLTDQCIFVGYPRRAGYVPDGEESGGIKAIKPVSRGRFKAAKITSSAMCLNFNTLWAQGLNLRDAERFTHYGMQHDDILPAANWADTCIDEAHIHNADIMSVVAPIKDKRGVTTTGLRNLVTRGIRRLTMAEIFRLPETFGLEDVQRAGIKTAPDVDPSDEVLVVNTGLFVCQFNGVWPTRFPGFHQEDLIRRVAGKYKAIFHPEDWLWSEWAASVGLRVMATRKVRLGHWEHPSQMIMGDDGSIRQKHAKLVDGCYEYEHGGREWRNDVVWGCDIDPGDS